MTMRILLLGCTGMLGYELASRLGGENELVGLSSREIDITDFASLKKIMQELRPQLVINAAAYTDVDGAEKDKNLAFAVNAEGVRNIALTAREIHCPVVHFGTDYIFDGSKGNPYREEDEANPLNVYGQSKLAGEKYLMEITDNYLLIRTAWLYGKKRKNFVKTIITKAKREKVLSVVDDQIGSPTYAFDLAGAVSLLIKKRAIGIYHVVNSGACSWFDFALAIVRSIGLDNVEIMPVKSKDYPRPARRPSYSVLDCSRFSFLTGFTMRSWEDALKDFLKNYLTNNLEI